MSSNLVIVAIPARDEKVWKVSSEKVPHLTLLFLGENTGDVAKLEQIVEFVDHAATMSQRGPFMLDVDERGTLGPDEADVLFFRKDSSMRWINQFRNQLLQQNDIRTAYDSVQQYPEWQPHLTLGYPTAPANEDEIPEHGLSWISFDRIAVWTEDFNGPEFKLTWPDRSQEEGCVAYSSNDARKALGLDALVKELAPLEHVGVKGMRWGVRKDTKVTVGGKTKMVSAKKAGRLDKQFENKVHSMDTFVKLHNAAANHVNQELPKINAQFDKSHPKEMTDGTLFNHLHPVTKAYTKAYTDALTEGLNKAAKDLGTNPTGTRRVKVETENHESLTEFGWRVKTEKVQHAANDVVDEPPIVFQVTLDKDGRITSIKAVEDSMAQTADIGAEFIEHHGVKGMKWGVRRVASAIGSGAKKVGNALGRFGVALADSAWQGSTYNDVKHEAVHNHVAEHLDSHIGRLQNSPKYRGKNLKANSDLRKTYYEDVAKVTEVSYRRGVKEVYGQNYTGTKSAHYVTDARGPRIEVRDTKTGEKHSESPLTSMAEIKKRRAEEAFLSQSAITDADAPDLSIDLTIDDNGQISGVGFVKSTDSAKHTADLGAEFIEHYGIKGMHWGIRSRQGTRSTPTAVAPKVTSKIPHGAKRKTKLEVSGGENHPAHEDAVKVAIAKAKLKKSGPSALSNQELRDVANRVQLENQVAVLTSKKGKQFVTRQLQNEGQNLARAGVRAGVKSGVKKVGAAAGTAAAVAA